MLFPAAQALKTARGAAPGAPPDWTAAGELCYKGMTAEDRRADWRAAA